MKRLMKKSSARDRGRDDKAIFQPATEREPIADPRWP